MPSGGGEEEAPMHQDPQQASTGVEGRESEREIGEGGDSASDSSAFVEKGNAETNKRKLCGETSESEREGEEGGAASGAQGDEEREGGAASGAQGDEEREGGESEEGGGDAGEEREEIAGNADGEREEGGEKESGGGKKTRKMHKRMRRRAELRQTGAGEQARVGTAEEATGDDRE